jgi:putative spermidine/putrescine transport system substrate-binding protein
MTQGNTKAASIHSVTRRTMLATSGAAIAAPMLSRRAWAQDVEGELVFAGPGGASQQVLEESMFPSFVAKYPGVKTTLITGQPADNLAKLRTQAAAPAIDVVWLAGGVTYQAIDEGLVAPLDKSLVPNLATVNQTLAVEDAAAPIGIAVVQLMYSLPIFQEKGWEAPTSWFDLWDSKFEGHVGMTSINISSAAGFLAVLAKLLTGDEKQVDAAFAKLAELRPNVLNYYTSLGAMETALQQGDVWVGNLTAHRGYQLRNAGTPIGMASPKEGGVGYQTWLGVVTGAPHPKAAHAWIDYLLSDEGQEQVRTGFGYTPVNTNVTIPEEDRLYFPDLATVNIPDWRYISSKLPEYADRWNREVER